MSGLKPPAGYVGSPQRDWIGAELAALSVRLQPKRFLRTYAFIRNQRPTRVFRPQRGDVFIRWILIGRQNILTPAYRAGSIFSPAT